MAESKTGAPNQPPPDYRPPPGASELFYLVVGALALFPLVLINLPALADLPNHLARIYIIDHLAGDADLQKSYTLHWGLLAFQSTDFILPPLANLFGLAGAARIYIVATFLLIFGGTALLHRALFGRVGLWPAVSALLFYNFMLAWGLISVLFAIGLMLLLFAAWIATREREGPLRSALFGVAALGLFLCHFFPFAVYAVLVAGYELGRLRGDHPPAPGTAGRRLLLAGATLVVPGVLFVLSAGATPGAINAWGGVNDKIRAILSPLTMYLSPPDYVIIGLVLAALLRARRRRLFSLSGAMRLPLAAIAVLTVAMPNQLASVWGADFRLPTILALLLVAASELRFRTRRDMIGFGAVLIAVMLVRVGFVTHDWLRYQADYNALRVAGESIDRGSRVLAVHALDDHRANPAPSLFPYRHAAAFAVIDRDVFLPHLFAAATPLRFGAPGREMESDQLAVLRQIRWRPKTAPFAATDPETIAQAEDVGRIVAGFDAFSSTFDWSDWPERFDFLIDFDYGARGNPVPALLTEVARGSYFAIYRIHPPAGG